MIEKDMLEIVKMIAPGTRIREGLDNILKAKTGGLIVASDSEEVMKIADGGFEINQEYSPAKIYELAKMDGAIIVSSDFKKILRANVELIPDYKIKTIETGTRHRAAERTSKQTGKLVICISHRRGIITLFKGNNRYVINETDTIIMRANQALEAMEKYKTVFDHTISNLNELELENMVSLDVVTSSIYRCEMVIRMGEEVTKNIIELGDEGRLIEIQLKQLLNGVEAEEIKIIEDYCVGLKKKKLVLDKALNSIKKLSNEETLNGEKVAKILGYVGEPNILDQMVTPRGYRILSKIPKMPINIIDNLIDAFYSLNGICMASINELDEVDGIGEARAKLINQALRKFEKQYLIKNYRV